MNPRSREAKNRAQHSVEVAIRCDVIDKSGEGKRFAATLVHTQNDGFFCGILRVKPHSARGKKVCARFKVGEVIGFDLGLNTLTARVANNGPHGTWIHAVDIMYQLIMPCYLPARITKPTLKMWRLRRE